MTSDKFAIFKNLILTANKNCLSSKKNRAKLAKVLSAEVGLWEPNVYSFVEEMAGLSFRNLDDRELFLQFAEIGL